MNLDDQIPDFQTFLQEHEERLGKLRQLRFLDESAFLSFCQKHGVKLSGITTGDPGKWVKEGLLTADGVDEQGRLYFHPFRLYPSLQLLNTSPQAFTQMSDKVRAASSGRNRVVDLTTILEPIYWPLITGVTTSSGSSWKELEALYDLHKEAIKPLVQGLDATIWENVHSQLRQDAFFLDRNADLYLLMRVSKWEKRDRLEGGVGGALWIRHVAEVLRLAFEEFHGVKWPEEDQFATVWYEGGRTMAYGAERPLDDEVVAAPYLAKSYGLLTGSVLRWYVEGETEYGFITEAIPERARAKIELVNLKGNIESGKNNTALKLGDWLAEDKSLKRFSMISFDNDVAANVKAISVHVRNDLVVGLVKAHKPDFEFSNFTLAELVEVAARYAEVQVADAGDMIRNASWDGVDSGRKFEKAVLKASESKLRELKGEGWGKALAVYASEYPNRSDTDRERPIWEEIRAALHAQISSYDFQARRYPIDPDSFEQVDKGEKAGWPVTNSSPEEE